MNISNAYFKICIFKASLVNQENLEKGGRRVSFGVISGFQTSGPLLGGTLSLHSLVSTWMTNSCLASPSSSFFPGVGVVLYVIDELLFVSFFPPGQQAAHRKHIITVAQCHRFHMARPAGKSVEFWEEISATPFGQQI